MAAHIQTPDKMPLCDLVLSLTGPYIAGLDTVANTTAVKGARACFESDGWRKLSARQRGRLLAKTADLLEARLDEFARLETAHNGKTLFESKIELGMTVNTLRYYAGWADKIVGDTLPVEGPFFVYTLREPIGVVGAIVPWNFPLNIASWKFAPALAAGCTVVLKPASETPLTALLFAELVQEAGFPAGAFNVVAGGGSTAGAALVRHAGVDKIAFTGSTEVGREIGAKTGRSLKRVTLELGGKSPNIILPDADVEAAVKGSYQAIYFNSGQACNAGSRLFVPAARFDEVVGALAEQAKSAQLGPGLDPSTQLGPLVSADRILTPAERSSLDGALAVDMESAWLAESAGGRPLAVLRVVVDRAGRRLSDPRIAVDGVRALRSLRRCSSVLSEWSAS